ncbi:hypothetical protein GCM10025772_23050 [Ferrimonas gelatinilytica]|uniref:Secreted protein n=1 Tax=Ferrimonas gelatinilytica TaxID=1255257 RepID=A0ABP9SAS6_9GAMM
MGVGSRVGMIIVTLSRIVLVRRGRSGHRSQEHIADGAAIPLSPSLLRVHGAGMGVSSRVGLDQGRSLPMEMSSRRRQGRNRQDQ